MKKIFLSATTATLIAFSFNGCTIKELLVGGESVKKAYETGTIENSQKVIVTKSKVAKLTYSAGTGDNSPFGRDNKNALDGLISTFQDVQAYQIEIKPTKNGFSRVGYIEKELPLNTLIEYAIKSNGEITDIEVRKVGTLVNKNH